MTDLGTTLDTARREIATFRATSNTSWRIVAETLSEAHSAIFAALPKREAQEAWQRFYEDEEFQAHQVSEMLTVAEWLGTAGRELPYSKQIAVARAVKRGMGTADELLPVAERLSLSAFREEVYGPKEPKHTEWRCAVCGSADVRKEET